MRNLMRLVVTAALPATLFVIPSTAHAGPDDCGRTTQDWTASDLGTFSRAHAVNERGQIAGTKVTNPGKVPPRHVAVLWQDGRLTELGHLFGAVLRGAHSWASDLDEAGRVAGFSTHLDGKRHAFVWANGFMRDLGEWGVYSTAHTIGAGVAGGYHEPTDAPGDVIRKRRPTLWDGNLIQIPGTPGAEVVDMNETGGLTGNENLSLDDSDRAEQAFARFGTDFRLLGTLGGPWSVASGINERGQIVGESAIDAGGVLQDAFIWDADNGMRRLPDHDTGNFAKPTAISDTGTIVGSYKCLLGEGPAVWPTADTAPSLLPLPPGATSASVEDINSQNTIVGTASYPDFTTRAAIWRKKS